MPCPSENFREDAENVRLRRHGVGGMAEPLNPPHLLRMLRRVVLRWFAEFCRILGFAKGLHHSTEADEAPFLASFLPLFFALFRIVFVIFAFEVAF